MRGHVAYAERENYNKTSTTYCFSPASVMQNIERVTAHLSAQLAGDPDRARRALTLVPARDGHNWLEY